MYVMGIAGTVVVSIHICGVALACLVMNKAMKEKDNSLLCCSISCDTFVAFLLFIVLIFTCAAVGDVRDGGVGGAVLSFLFTFVEFALVAYLVYGGCKIRDYLKSENKPSSSE